jgi:hypothetical protein
LETKDFGRLFVQKLYYANRAAPRLAVEVVTEIDAPWRTGIARVLRIPFTRTALVVGWWTGVGNEMENLSGAVQSREQDIKPLMEMWHEMDLTELPEGWEVRKPA